MINKYYDEAKVSEKYLKKHLLLWLLLFCIALTVGNVTVVHGSVDWHLDRIDEHNLPMNGSYTYYESGAGVHIYVFDTGVKNHSEYNGRLGNGVSFVSGSPHYVDCGGHGSKVASAAGGTTVGVAKEVIIHSVKVGCPDASTMAWLDAIDWINLNHKKPAIINISREFPWNNVAVSDAIEASIDAHQLTYVIAAGNTSTYNCNNTPQNVLDAINVGGSNIADERVPSSSSGYCVDTFAPGADIRVADPNGWNSFANATGTSLAAPIVAGCLARYMQFHANASFVTNETWLFANDTEDELTNIPVGTPNRLLYCPSVAGSPSGFHRLQVEHSDKFLGILPESPPPWEGGGPASQHSNGADAHQWHGNSGTAQRWNLQRAGNGYYQIINKLSGKCLGVNTNSQLGAIGQVHQWNCNYSSDSQQWRFEPIGPTWASNYRIRNKASANSAKCIDIENASQANYAKAKLWWCHENENQQWAITPP